MATMVNRDYWWSVDGRAVKVRVVSQNLKDETCEVLTANGAHHTANAYDLWMSEEDANEHNATIERRDDWLTLNLQRDEELAERRAMLFDGYE